MPWENFKQRVDGPVLWDSSVMGAGGWKDVPEDGGSNKDGASEGHGEQGAEAQGTGWAAGNSGTAMPLAGRGGGTPVAGM